MNIYFYTPEFSSGGVKILYRHASILTNYGYSSYVLHCKRGYKCSEFDNNAKIKYLREIKIKDSDILVMPEFLAIYSNRSANPKGVFKKIWKRYFADDRYLYWAFDLFNGKAKIVMYNQNAYLTFMSYPKKINKYTLPYFNKNCIGTVVVSEDSYEYLSKAFKLRNLYRVRCGINSNLFFPSANKKKQIAYFTFKNSSDVSQVINLLQQRNNLKNYSLIDVNGTEKEVAEKLNESKIMLNFGNVEGFGLPPAEAMLSGCIVIGYHGQGGKEFVNKDYSFPIENGDIISFVEKIEEIVLKLNYDSHCFDYIIERARLNIIQEYSLSREMESVINTWTQIIEIAKNQNQCG